MSTPALNWKAGGALYLPLLNATEVKYGIPTDLLARIAFQESSWRPGVIDGTIKSEAGAVGLMQMEPLYFPHVNLTDPNEAIPAAGYYLKCLYEQFKSWTLAVAAYNCGPGNVRKYGGVPPFAETISYLKDIFSDVKISDA